MPDTAHELTTDSLNGFADELADLMGNSYSAFESVDLKGLRSPTPPTRRHRVVELVASLRSAATDVRPSRLWHPPAFDSTLVGEAILMVEVFRKWRNHPHRPYLLDSLLSSEEPQHTMMLLAVASYFTDMGKGVGIYPNSGSVVSPDLWLQDTLAERIELEVKTPQLLRRPRGLLSPSLCDRIALREYKATKKQLSSGDSGLLVLGGFHLGQTFEQLNYSAERLLTRRARYRPNLVGIAIADIASATTKSDRGDMFVPMLRIQINTHPGYKGRTRFQPNPNREGPTQFLS